MDISFFPTELLHDVIALTLGRYLGDILIAPVSTRSWDAIGTLLHVDYHFRSCTLRVLDALWDGTFTDRKSGHPRNYTHKIEYLRCLAELAQIDPSGVLPPARHVLSMRVNTMPYERIGRYFVVHQARVNIGLASDRREERLELLRQFGMSDLTESFSALPRGLRDRMFSEFADYVVDNLLVRVRAIAFRALVNDAAVFVAHSRLFEVCSQARVPYAHHSRRTPCTGCLQFQREILP
ncbi:hypothetical protein F5148DRAFT_358458 [Russula earlei]|uniref:Uncharacterized protein n=1 Tax=Russula earlei TaxID=71964 RepID=A0ACC0UIG4_9AGAM|nr:hypothetical protein F5148DRAFT_358458 [Russula earlei]